MRSTPIQSLVVLTAAVALTCVRDVRSAPLQSPSSPQNKPSIVTIDQSLGSLRSPLNHLGSDSESPSLEPRAPNTPFGEQGLESRLERRSVDPTAQKNPGKVTNRVAAHPVARASTVGSPENPTFSNEEAVHDPIRVRIPPSPDPFFVQGRSAATDQSGIDQRPASTQPRNPTSGSRAKQRGPSTQPHWSPEDAAFAKILPNLRKDLKRIIKKPDPIDLKSMKLQRALERQLALIDKEYPAGGKADPVELKKRLIRMASTYHSNLIGKETDNRWGLEPDRVRKLKATADGIHIPKLEALAGFTKGSVVPKSIPV